MRPSIGDWIGGLCLVVIIIAMMYLPLLWT